jgi:hypothetical protein
MTMKDLAFTRRKLVAEIIEKRLVVGAVNGVGRVNKLVRWTGHGFVRCASNRFPKSPRWGVNSLIGKRFRNYSGHSRAMSTGCRAWAAIHFFTNLRMVVV